MFTRRRLLAQSALTAAGLALPRGPAVAELALLDQLVLSGPPSPPSIILARVASQEALKMHAKTIRFEQWKSPDQLRAGVLSGSYHVAATPVNVAANLYNKGAPIRLLDVTVWGVLSIVTTDSGITSIADLKGREIAVPFRGDVPDIVLRVLLRKAGLTPGSDLKITYVGSPIEGMQLLVARSVSTALLPEPATTAALIRGKGIGLVLRKAIDVQDAWGKTMGGPSRFPQAGTLIQAKLADEHPELVRTLGAAAREAIAWIKDNGPSAARVGAEQFRLDAEIILQSLKATQLEWKSASAAKAEIERFFGILADFEPAAIGGKLPDERLYLD
ncbi:MAG: ABC transporter substrate-binding protein [Pseudolabrys sp.]|nr:ABC transporter substrate-binding protein [Pseudolabrys sp.]MDP2296233.1 ABC transporter substrate-binding protein [Pseudolabrys sp.]